MTMYRATIVKDLAKRMTRTRDDAGWQVQLTLKLYDNGLLKVDPSPSWTADEAGWLGAAEYLVQALAVFQRLAADKQEEAQR